MNHTTAIKGDDLASRISQITWPHARHVAEKLASYPEVCFPLIAYEALKYRGAGIRTVRALMDVGLVIEDPLSGLPTRAKNCLHECGAKNREDALHAVLSGVMRPYKNPRNYGRTTEECIYRWLGIVKPSDPIPERKRVMPIGGIRPFIESLRDIATTLRKTHNHQALSALGSVFKQHGLSL